MKDAVRRTSRANDPEIREEERLMNQAERKFNFYGTGTTLGVMGGIAMGALVLLIQSVDNTLGFRTLIVGCLVVLPFVYFGIRRYAIALKRKIVFQNGALLGMFISLVATVTYVVFNLVAKALGLDGWEQFGYDGAAETSNFIEIVLTSSFVILVAGLIGTFISLQLLKNPDRE